MARLVSGRWSRGVGGGGRRAEGALPEQARDEGVYYRPELDALRFVAFCFVFLFHRMDYVGTDPVRDVWGFRIGTAGAFGVPVFFLLSAFLITELLVRERELTGRVHVGAFYVRRILRIWPMYFLVFFGLAGLNTVMPGLGTDDRHAWLAFSLFSGNWWITFHGWIAGSVDPLWSISVEEQFYLLVPLLVLAGGRRALWGWAVGLLLVSYGAVLWYGLHPVAGDNGEWTNSLVHFQFFSAGTAVSLLLRGRLPRWSVGVRVLGFVAGIGAWFVAMLRFGVRSWDPRTTAAGAVAGWALVLLGCVLMLVCSLGWPASRVPKGLAYAGRISYGLYLLHSFVFFLLFEKLGPVWRAMFPRLTLPRVVTDNVGSGLVLLLTFALAHLAYRYFERPILSLKRRFTFVRAREEMAPTP